MACNCYENFTKVSCYIPNSVLNEFKIKGTCSRNYLALKFLITII